MSQYPAGPGGAVPGGRAAPPGTGPTHDGPVLEGHALAGPALDGPEDWHRVHPLTPVLKGWAFLVVVLGVLLAQSEQFFEGVVSGWVSGDPGESGGPIRWLLDNPLYIVAGLGGLLLVAGIVVFFSWLSWRAMGYRVDARSLYFRKGILFKQRRSAHLDRVQSIDIRQPFVPRLVGLAVLRFDVAGGAKSSIDIEFISRTRAEALRETMLGLVRDAKSAAKSSSTPAEATPGSSGTVGADAAGRGTPGGTASAGRVDRTGAPAGAAASAKANRSGANLGSRVVDVVSRTSDEVGTDLASTLDEVLAPYRLHTRVTRDGRLLRVPAHRVFLSALLDSGTIVTVLVGLALVVSSIVLAVLGRFEIALPLFFGVVPVVIAGVSAFLKHLSYANFTVELSADGLGVSHGLLSTTRKVLPLDRIQAVRLSQPLLWRGPGWWKAEFNTAGGNDEGQNADAVLLPVGTLEDALLMLGLALPDPRPAPGTNARDLITAGMDVPREMPDPYMLNPRSSRWLDPLSFKRNGWSTTGSMTLLRTGALHRRVTCVPHARVQSMSLRTGPVQRRLGLSTVVLDSTSGPIKPVLEHLGTEVAADFFMTHARTTRAARAELDGY